MSKVIAKLHRVPRTLNMLMNIEWGQFRTRGLAGYMQLRYKSLRSHVSDRYPQALQIEPYGGCNIRCSMCFQGKMRLPADKDLLDFDLYCRIIDEVSPYTPRLYLYWRGEPMLHPRLGDMIAHARKRGLYVFVSTNAVLLDEKRAQEFIDVGLDFLLVGFDGATKTSYEKMRRGAKFETILANIKNLISLKREQRSLLPHVSLQFIISAINKGELQAFRNLAQDIGADSYIEKILDIYANFKNPKIDNSLQILYVDGEWSKYDGREDGLTPTGITKCDMARRLVVRADGELNLCCYDMQGQYKIASACNNEIMPIWDSSAYVQLRNQGHKRFLELCQNCGVGLQR